MADEVKDNVARSRYELEVDGHTAFIDYCQDGAVRVLTHTEVPAALRGAGIAGRLAAGALAMVRERGEMIVPRCSYLVQFLERNPQYQDLVAAR